MTFPLWDASRYIELSVLEAGREVCIAGKTVHFDPKPYPLLHYVYVGKGILTYKDKSYRLKTGDCFLIPANDHATYSSLEEDPWSYFWLGLGGSKGKALLESVGFSEANPVLHDRNKAWKEYFKNIYEAYFHSGEFGLKTLGYAYLLLHAMTTGKEEEGEEREKGHIQAAKSYIRNNFQFAISMEDVANSVGVSPNYLANLFQKEGEPSPKAYLTKVRMEEAGKLLVEFSSPIGEIAKAVGYRNPLHFSKIFKNHYGISPMQYRSQGGKKQ